MYEYEELKNAALAPNATQEDINALGKWFMCYGSRYWNGEYYEIDNHHRLFEVLEYDGDEMDYVLVGYEIR